MKQDARWAPKARGGLPRKLLGKASNRDFRGAKDHVNRDVSVSQPRDAGLKAQGKLKQARRNGAEERKLPGQGEDFVADSSGRLYSLVQGESSQLNEDLCTTLVALDFH